MNKVHLGDCIKFMEKNPDNIYDLTIVDAPYNIGKAEWDKWKNQQDYYDFILRTMEEVARVTKDKSKAAKYEHFDELKVYLANGWSAPSIHAYLERQYGTEGLPSIRAIQRWKNNHMPEAMVIPHRLIKTKLKGVNYKVDLLRQLARLIPLLEDRVCRGLEEELAIGGWPLPNNDDIIRQYLEVLEEYAQLERDFGILSTRLRE